MLFLQKVVLFLSIFIGGIQRLKKGVEVGNFKKYFLISKYKIVFFFNSCRSFFLLKKSLTTLKSRYIVFIYHLITTVIVKIFITEVLVKFGVFH